MRKLTLKLGVIAVAILVHILPLAAQGDEIQVYDGGLSPVGVFNLTWHNNYTPDGIRTPAFPGAVVSHHSLNGVPEWAYGVTDWFEAGLYMPLYSVGTRNGETRAMLNGFKLRTLFAVPHADDRTFFYGANFEFSINAKHWDPQRFTSEIRPIVGVHLHPVDIIVNPIVDTNYRGGIKALEFVPATRVAYNMKNQWAIAAEEYGDFGTLDSFYPRRAQAQQLFAVIDHTGGFADVEAGVGFGLTDASDKLQLKLILSKDLNR